MASNSLAFAHTGYLSPNFPLVDFRFGPCQALPEASLKRFRASASRAACGGAQAAGGGGGRAVSLAQVPSGLAKSKLLG